jgi:hypothetical protein
MITIVAFIILAIKIIIYVDRLIFADMSALILRRMLFVHILIDITSQKRTSRLLYKTTC